MRRGHGCAGRRRVTKQGKEAEIKKENELSEKWTERRAKERETERQ